MDAMAFMHHHHQQQQHMAQASVSTPMAAPLFAPQGFAAPAASSAAAMAASDELDFLGDEAAAAAEAGASSPAPSSASSSTKDKWQKRHACDVPDCGKSFDSKWALIRCVVADRKRGSREISDAW